MPGVLEIVARPQQSTLLCGDLGAAWIAATEVKVAFVFHVKGGLVREVELLADPDILATITVKRQNRTQPS